MSNCGCSDNNKPIIPPPPPECPPYVPPCPEGEQCEDPIDAHCVRYWGTAIPTIGVLTGDRLDNILNKLGLNQGTNLTLVENSNTISMTGNGLGTAPISSEVKLDSDEDQLIKVTDEGLLVKADICMAQDLLAVINGDENTRALFCAIVQSCSGGVCGYATNMVVTYTSPNFILSWTPFNQNVIAQNVQYKRRDSLIWITASTVGATDTTYSIGGLLRNTLYDFRIETICYIGGPNYNGAITDIGFVCPTTSVVTTHDRFTFSFPYLPSDVTLFTFNLYEGPCNRSTGTLVNTHVVNLVTNPATSVAHSFIDLDPETTYYMEIVMSDASGAYTNTCYSCATTLAAPVCVIPQNLNTSFN